MRKTKAINFHIRDVQPRIERNKIHIPFNGKVKMMVNPSKGEASPFWSSKTSLIFDSEDYKELTVKWMIKYPLAKKMHMLADITSDPSPTVLGWTLHTGQKICRFGKVNGNWMILHGNSKLCKEFRCRHDR